MSGNRNKKFFIDARKKIFENANNILNESLQLYRAGFYQRAVFLAMTCMEECGKLWFVRSESLDPTSIEMSQFDQVLHDHTGKVFNLAMGFFINATADRRQGKHPVSKMYITSGIMLLARSKKWMKWRNSCLYVDVSVKKKSCKTPVDMIGKPEACYFIRMAFEGLIANVSTAYETGHDLFGITSKDLSNMPDSEIALLTKEFTESEDKNHSVYFDKETELEQFISENKDVDFNQIVFLKNPEQYQESIQKEEDKSN